MTSHESSAWAASNLRHADLADVPAIERLVNLAYEKYVPRIGRKPKPMVADYRHAIANHQTWVLANEESLFAVLEMIPGTGFLLIENITVAPDSRRAGYGRGLMFFAESEAKGQGLSEMRLYTNAKFTENIHFYTRIGYTETHRESYKESDVVHMTKLL